MLAVFQEPDNFAGDAGQSSTGAPDLGRLFRAGIQDVNRLGVGNHTPWFSFIHNGHTLATCLESYERHCVSTAPRRCAIAGSWQPPPMLPRGGCMPGSQASTIQGSVAKFDFWAKSKNRVSGMQ